MRMWRSAIVAMVTCTALVATALPAYATIMDKRNDYDNDLISDVVAFSSDDECLYRWSGRSGGGLGNAVRLGCEGWSPYRGTFIAPGDLNGDGHGDLIALHDNPSECMVRWYGNGRGGFGSGTQLGCNWGLFRYGLTGAGDLNNDNNGDVVSINAGDKCLYRWFGNGTGSFGDDSRVSCGWGNYLGNMTGAGDLNNDGNADLVAINTSTRCLVRWYGNGRGGFADGVQLSCGWDRYLGEGRLSGMGAMNGNGHGDLLAVWDGHDLSDCLYRFFGNGRGGYGTGTLVGCGWSGYGLAN